MTEISSEILLSFLIFITIPFLFALFFKKNQLSPLVGYIIGGLILGNFLGSFYSTEVINNFAYFGIILLLFTVGLEVNFNQIFNLKKFIVIGGLVQLVASIIFVFLISLIFKFNLITSFLIGIAFSSSSTALVAKIIQDRGEESTFLGEMAIGILMFQDLAFIPFLIIFTSITNRNLSFLEINKDIFISFFKATIIIYFLFYLGKKIIPLIFNKLSKISRELLNLFIIVFIFLITYLSTILNIPILVGVFVAGILVGQTLEHYHIFSQVRPLRDLLAVIFFVFIGFNLHFNSIIDRIPSLIIFFLMVIFVKWLIILLLFLIFRFHSRTAFFLATYLFQIDEDAFILLSQAYLNQVIRLKDYSFSIGVVILSLLLTPIVIQNKDQLYLSLRKIIKRFLPFIDNYLRYRIDRDISPIDVLKLKNHIVICGYGRVGSYVGRALMLANIPFIAIDYNSYVVEKAKKQGVNIIYGDPTDIDILDYAEVDNARLLICAVPDRFSQESVIINAKRLNPQIIIITRIQKEEERQKIKNLGGEVIIQPEFEASLTIIRHIFYLFGIDKKEIIQQIKRIKIEHETI